MKQFSTRLLLCAVVVFFMISGKVMAQNPDDIIGTWLTGSTEAKVQVYKEGAKYFGKIVWLKTPLNSEGKPKLDKENPIAKLKTRPILGMVNLLGLVYDSGKDYEKGVIYDPKNGKTYECYVWLEGKETLQLKGFVAGIRMLGRKSAWTRTTL